MIQNIVFIHIAKAAGTTFHFMLKPSHNIRVIKGNWEIYENPKYYEKVKEEVGYNTSELYKKFSVIRGSYPYQRFYYLKQRHGWKMITWIRDPVERLISNYNHLVHRPSPNLIKKSAKQRLVFNKTRNMSIVEFSRYVSDFNTRHIGEDPSIFDFIGVVEKYDKSLEVFNDRFNCNLRNTRRSNVHKWKKEKVPKSVREIMKQDHPKDYEFYNKVKERYK